METETTLPADECEDDEFEDDEYEEYVSYGTEMHEAMAPIVKKFLVDFFGDEMYNLEPDTYREIDQIIKDAFLSGDSIPDHFYRHRTIKDEDLWEEAYTNFKRKDAKFNWQKITQWYDREYVNDDEDGFLEGISESELTEDQKLAKKVFESADKMINFQVGFSLFTKQGCNLMIPAMQKFIEDTASFDLSILSPEGWEQVQDDLEGIADYLFDHLYMISPEED